MENDKELLMTELCERLQCGVICDFYDEEHNKHSKAKLMKISQTRFKGWDRDVVDIIGEGINGDYTKYVYGAGDVIPYLRPMSEMTEEEKNELSDYLCEKCDSSKKGITFPPNKTNGKLVTFEWMHDCIVWLNKRHFDHSGLIEKGLALTAPYGMYNMEIGK
jgi:hypothetical protein